MLHDDIILELVKDLNVEIKEVPTNNVTIDRWMEALQVVDLQSDFDVIVDLDSMGSGTDSEFDRYGRVSRVILFIKSVMGKKQTFARSSFVVNNNIQTIGTAGINPANHNLVDRSIIFGKAVLAKRTTFGKSSLTIANNIQTVAVNTIGGVNFYGSGLYGAGTFGTMLGYGSAAYGVGIYSGESIRMTIGFGATVSGNIPIKQTAVGEISLASHAVPALRINHKIKIRARTTSGSTGVIKAALYEGGINRSGDLTTSPLTNSLAEYTLAIPEAAAATITDYSNLSIRFWGYDSAGNPLTFVIANIYLELPVQTGGIQYGVVSRPITFTKAVSGIASSKKTATAEISLASHGIPSARTNHRIIIRARTTSGSTGVIKAALYEGANNRSGDLITTPLTNTFADYPLVILNAAAATITDYSNLSIRFWGFDINNQALVFEVSKVYLELPTSTGNITQYGIVARGITFTKAVSGTKKTFGQIVRPFTFVKSVAGTIPGSNFVSRVITFTKSVSGIVSSKKTTTAEISLASHGTPSVRTNHSIEVKARTTTGSTGVLKAELYEGATKRSGATPLTTTALTNSLATYSLAIPDASAATITDYSNLSIRFWGFDSAGNALVFEVSNIYLKLPTP